MKKERKERESPRAGYLNKKRPRERERETQSREESREGGLDNNDREGAALAARKILCQGPARSLHKFRPPPPEK